MAIWNRKSILTNAINDWHQRGLLDDTTKHNLALDIDDSATGFGFRNILILLAVVCLGFAAMTFVAANWQDMPRLVRAALIFAAMWMFWGLSAFFHHRGNSWFPQVFTLGACAMFGAGIMLISQIYHIQGSPKDATWLWAIGTLGAAALTRSVPALSLAVSLFTVWAFVEPNMFTRSAPALTGFPIYMILCAALSYWMHSRFTAHLIVLAGAVWSFTTAISVFEHGSVSFYAALIAAGFILLSASLFSDKKRQILQGFEPALIFYLFALLGASISVMYFMNHEFASQQETMDVFAQTLIPALIGTIATGVLAAFAHIQQHPNKYDLTVTTIFCAITFALLIFGFGVAFATEALMLAGSIWIIRMGWRIEYRPIAVLGFVVFGLTMLLIYFETVGTLLGTSMFYLFAGIILLLGVFLVPRLTKSAGETS